MERAIFFPLPCLLVRLSLAWGCSLTHLSLTFHLASPSPHRNCKRLCRSDPFSLSLMLQKRLLPRRQWKPQWNIQIKRFLKSGAQRKKISEPVETVWEYYENVLKYHFCCHYWILMTWTTTQLFSSWKIYCIVLFIPGLSQFYYSKANRIF